MFNFLNKLQGKEVLPLPPLPGKEESWQWRGHKIVFSVLGEGAPLLLVHGINAASWAFEYRRNFEAFAGRYRVYAPDLPGFGRSERKKMTYTAALYIEFLVDFARFVMEREGHAPAALSSSLPAAHLIGAAHKAPEAFGPLMLVCPTGLERLDTPPGKTSLRIHNLLMGPLGSLIFALLTGRRSTRVFLGRDGYLDPKYIDEELIEGYYRTSHQPNAKYAPIAFITFLLNHSVKEEWPALKQPVLLVWGKQAMITPLENSEMFLKTRPGTTLEVIDGCRLAPYDEQATEFNRIALNWLAQNYSGTEKKETEKARRKVA